MTRTQQSGGFVAPGFENVAEAFERNFSERSEVGAAFAAIRDGRLAFGVGFELQTEDEPFGPVADAFGHGGAGGSKYGAWPGLQVGFSYAMNLMRDDEDEDGRARALLRALHEAVT